MVRRRPPVPGALLVIALLLLSCLGISYATLIATIKTPDGVWVGADSVRSFSNGEALWNVCKVHETPDGLLLKLGDGQGFDRYGADYSTDTVVRKALEEYKTQDDFERLILDTYRTQIEEEMIYDISGISGRPAREFTEPLSSYPVPFPLPRDEAVKRARSIVLINLKAIPAKIAEFNVGPWLQHHTGPPFWVWSVRTFDSWTDPYFAYSVVSREFQRKSGVLRQFGDAVDFDRSDDWIVAHPHQALIQLLQQAHDTPKYSQHVGPPYVIVHVVRRNGQKQSIQWVERGVCPSWTENVLSDDPVRDSRNP